MKLGINLSTVLLRFHHNISIRSDWAIATLWYSVFFRFAAELWYSCSVHHVRPNIFTLVLAVPEILLLFKSNFAKLTSAAVFFLEGRGSLLITLSNKPYTFSPFPTVLSWTLIYNKVTEAGRVWDAALKGFLQLLWAWFDLTLGTSNGLLTHLR